MGGAMPRLVIISHSRLELSAADAMRRQHATPDAKQHQYHQCGAQPHPPGQCVDGSLGLTLVDDHVIQPRAKVVEDQDEEQDDDDFRPHDGCALDQTEP